MELADDKSSGASVATKADADLKSTTCAEMMAATLFALASIAVLLVFRLVLPLVAALKAAPGAFFDFDEFQHSHSA
jgi:hypothetical protein